MHGATTSLSTAQATANDPNPVNRLIYVNTTPPAGGGAIEMLIPSGGWVMYGIQWPQPSRANPATNAIVFRQGGVQVPNITIYRTDGTNGDSNYDPIFPFKMRGRVDPYTGQPVVAAGEGNVSNLTYAINIPVVTNAPFDILVRSDASTSNTLVKLDGGIDLNSQMGLGPTNSQGGTTVWRRPISSTCATTARLCRRPFSRLRTNGVPVPQRPGEIRRAEHFEQQHRLAAARRRIITPSAARTRSSPAPALARASPTRPQTGFITIRRRR